MESGISSLSIVHTSFLYYTCSTFFRARKCLQLPSLPSPRHTVALPSPSPLSSLNDAPPLQHTTPRCDTATRHRNNTTRSHRAPTARSSPNGGTRVLSATFYEWQLRHQYQAEKLRLPQDPQRDVRGRTRRRLTQSVVPYIKHHNRPLTTWGCWDPFTLYVDIRMYSVHLNIISHAIALMHSSALSKSK